MIDINDHLAPLCHSIGDTDYETLISSGDPDFEGVWPTDEWQPIALNYTSGTTGDPKGVVASHRGTYLMSLLQMTNWPLSRAPRYLWTLPMFHANGWCFTWAITAAAGTHVCLRKVSAETVFEAIDNQDVDHFCAAPVVMAMIANAADRPPLKKPVYLKSISTARCQQAAAANTLRLRFFCRAFAASSVTMAEQASRPQPHSASDVPPHR